MHQMVSLEDRTRTRKRLPVQEAISRLHYMVSANLSDRDIEKAKASPSFEREYNLKYW